jgi:D-amino-acid oxidase
LAVPQLDPLAGSSAALGLLMGQIYRRSSGRGWRLRQRSLLLWQQWRAELESHQHPIPFQAGLLQLALNEAQQAQQQQLVRERQAQGYPLQLFSPQQLANLQPSCPGGAFGAVFSPADGQLDPLAAMRAFLQDGQRLGLHTIAAAVEGLDRGTNPGWTARLNDGRRLACDWLVVSAGLQSAALLEPLGHARPQAPALGQALELQLPAGAAHGLNWPGSLSWDGINLVPRPGGRLWLGATLEPDRHQGEPTALDELRQLHGAAPPWLREAQILRQWQGLRARPIGRPAPLLELLEPGLLLVSGHYRNGVLLAPASAEWAGQQIAAAPGTSTAVTFDPSSLA